MKPRVIIIFSAVLLIGFSSAAGYIMGTYYVCAPVAICRQWVRPSAQILVPATILAFLIFGYYRGRSLVFLSGGFPYSAFLLSAWYFDPYFTFSRIFSSILEGLIYLIVPWNIPILFWETLQG